MITIAHPLIQHPQAQHPQNRKEDVKMANNIFVDVSNYQDDSISFFQKIKDLGASAVAVKLTEGSNPGSAYLNPKAKSQIDNAKSVGLKIALYHFGDFNGDSDAKAEAAWFLKNANAFGIDKATPVFLDIENSKVNASPATSDANSFLNAIKSGGFSNVGIYSMRSWFTSGRLNASELVSKNIWIAEYGVSKPGMTGYTQWQFTDNWNGLKVDASIDYSGFVTGTEKTSTPSTSTSTAAKASTSTAATFRDSLGVVWTKQNGTFTTDREIRLRWGATTSSNIIAILQSGASINYDAYCYSGGYVWLRQPRGRNAFGTSYGYIASGVEKDGKRQDYWGKFK